MKTPGYAQSRPRHYLPQSADVWGSPRECAVRYQLISCQLLLATAALRHLAGTEDIPSALQGAGHSR